MSDIHVTVSPQVVRATVEQPLVRVVKFGAQGPPGPTGVYPTPERTLFVSAGFTGLSTPHYTTIQAAINAATSGDVVLVYPGVYEENITLKAGVKLIGLDRDTVEVTSVAGYVLTAAPTAGDVYWVENLFINATDRSVNLPISVAGTTFIFRGVKFFDSLVDGITITLSALGSSGTISFEGCDFRHTGAGSSVKYDNAVGGAMKTTFQNCSFFMQTSSSLSAIIINPVGLTFQGCVFRHTSSSIAIQLLTAAYGAVGLVVSNCSFVGSGINARAFQCADTGAIQIPNYFSNCTFVYARIDLNSSALNFYVTNCGFMNSTGKVTTAAAFTGVVNIRSCFIEGACSFGGGTVRIMSSSLNNAIFINATGTYSFCDVNVRVTSGDGIFSSVAVTVFLGNFTTNGTINANVTQAVGSFNVQAGLTIP